MRFRRSLVFFLFNRTVTSAAHFSQQRKMIEHSNDFLLTSLSVSSFPVHLIILNSPSISRELLKQVWMRTETRVCADGGANRLYDLFDEAERETYLPSYVTGDLDSLRSDVERYYSQKGISIIQDPDQESHDLDKSLQLLLKSISPGQERDCKVLVLGGMGGRVDQSFAIFNTLYSWRATFPRIILLDEECVSFLLHSQIENRIKIIRENGVYEGKSVGLVPLGTPVRSIHTKGLMWNLENEPLEFGKRISTSNTVIEGTKEIIIETSDPILWTCTWKNG